MSETFDHIEAYLAGRLPAAEKQAFEDRCISDQVFAEQVAFYVSLRDGVQQELQAQKRASFAELHDKLLAARPAKGSVVRLWQVAAIAAAILIFFVVRTVFFNQPTAQALAANYIETNFTTIGITMGNNTDSLQAGIAAYNRKNFSEAEKIFESLQQGRPQQVEAVKYLGILYLTAGNYNKALAQFDTLSQNTQLYANPGPFYKAVTLMKRSGPGDKEAARTLLQEVVQKDLPGAAEATAWLKKL